MNPLDEHWRIGEPCEIVTVNGEFIANCEGMTVANYPERDDEQINRDIAIAHHIIAIHNQWLEGNSDD